MIEKIFDAVVIVGLYSPDCQSEEPFITPTTPHERSSSLFSNTSESTAKNEVVTIYSFIESDFPVPPSIGWFCFPEKAAHYSSTFRREFVSFIRHDYFFTIQ
ncbi:hypothetical protein BLNAU_20375 [Blattamonas nauphoetae]|uniref:Uncharacterized protein n=1 Tax=Blattamonas nauphoetae TaxID=2049346 RepID=A0ABQ9X184_9EUKA|nr:hypothetical protein BLNAU_20375 [Blattamonas nauphoetae]